MNEESVPKPPEPRKPVNVPPGARPGISRGPAPRVITAPGASVPAPRSIVRSLLATRGWTNINAFAFIIFGCLAAVRTALRWSEFDNDVKILKQSALVEDNTFSWAVFMGRAEMVFAFLLAAACLFAAAKLFRYSGSIGRLQQASRMQELENALRHQHTVWMVLGTAGAMWLLLFSSQAIFFFIGMHHLQEARTEMETEQ